MKFKFITSVILLASMTGSTLVGCTNNKEINRNDDKKIKQEKQEIDKSSDSIDFIAKELTEVENNIRENLTLIRNETDKDKLEEVITELQEESGRSRTEVLNLIQKIKFMSDTEFDMLVRQEIAIAKGDDDGFWDLLEEELSDEYINSVKKETFTGGVKASPEGYKYGLEEDEVVTGKDKDPDFSEEYKERLIYTFDVGDSVKTHEVFIDLLKYLSTNPDYGMNEFIIVDAQDHLVSTNLEDTDLDTPIKDIDLSNVKLFGYPVKIKKDYIYIKQIVADMRDKNPLILKAKYKDIKDGVATIEISDCGMFEKNILGIVKVPLN